MSEHLTERDLIVGFVLHMVDQEGPEYHDAAMQDAKRILAQVRAEARAEIVNSIRSTIIKDALPALDSALLRLAHERADQIEKEAGRG
ncbi:hypothetical protein DFO66_103356 [Brevibacterium sanguinis]|uniref:Uncharacterized protein n=2 Tax=Brevibacterium TaxID=1696 RepID=A0A366IMG4_9MICO|nr:MULTISPECIES: hypothetical protein [Brevibacterium]RBP66409.1 hypothetical protein DFO66_103356 [Brevibacterium sanguinis]RBP73061.1 hypothetical protein DFO65_103356 [Brevibacterium celere]